MRPKKWDIAVVVAVVLLSAVTAAAFYGPKLHSGANLTAVIRAEGTVVERIPLSSVEDQETRTVKGAAYTLTLSLSPRGVAVTYADCPSQDCVHTGTITRPGQSIVCLPGQVVIHLEGEAAGDTPDVIVG